MKTLKQSIRKALSVTGTAAVISFAALPLAVNPWSIGDSYAEQPTEQGHQGSGQQRGGGAGKGGQQGQGQGGSKSVFDKIFSVFSDEEEGDDDSDRPEWAQGNREANPHSSGSQGKPDAAGTMKGDLFGDLWIILRDDSGEPVLDANGQVQPIIIVDGVPTVIQLVDTDGDGKYEVPVEYADAVQEVDVGRTNVARSPSKVLDHSLTEALSKLDGTTLGDETVTVDDAGRLVVDGSTIDSPLENLAIYQALLTATDSNDDGLLEVKVDYSGEAGSGTYTFLVPVDSQLDLAASLFAAASDKTASLTVDNIVTVSTFLGVNDELANLVSNYTYDGASTAYKDSSVYVNVQVDGLDTPDDLSDDVYQSVEVNLVTGGTTTYDGETITVPGVSFETIANTVDNNADGTLDANDNDGIDGFTQTADDALQVIEFVHDIGIE
ncbi:hypothetical protein Q9L42_018610 [Methylomarinum sp. Ch1-1]|uniref:Uncharacterized protein n=1 Tax=Methylomarinum roseum TaxID=3067653 RepID=A0AAU7NTJ1_9GAMM|nr:hypothetical protein [Methylomarinum sp. Ch1-1]MDP4519611.1 hypothetical protein [Methylomarinum sp. Ch1-1]